MHNALLAVAMLLAQVPDVDEVALEAPSWELFVGVAGGLRTDHPGGGAVGLVGINRRVFSWLRPELSVGLAMYATPLDAVIPIKIGTRLEWPSDAWIKPYLFVAFAHLHELGWEEAKADPITGLLGLSSHGDHGVHHRSGLDSGIGVSADFPHFKGSRFGGRLNLRASVTHLLGEGPSRYVDLIATFGLTL
jgi:hypothetical protein